MTMTKPILEPQFDLRCRDAEWIDQEQVVTATLADFGRSPEARRPRSTEDVLRRYQSVGDLLVADSLARSHYQLDRLVPGRTVLTCEMARFGIPTGEVAASVEGWTLDPGLDAELIELDALGRVEHSVAAQVRRGLMAVAGTVPLLLGPALAHAGGPAGAGQELATQLAPQLGAFAPPTLPKDGAPKAKEPKGEGAEEGSGEATSTEAPTVAEPPATTAPATTAPAPRVDSSLTLTGRTVWEGLLDKRVTLAMKNGQSLTGTIVAQTNADLAVARTSDGMVVSVPKAEIAGVRMKAGEQAASYGGGGGGGGVGPIADRPTQDGRGLVAGGAVMIVFGSMAVLSGTVLSAFGAYSPYYLFIGLPLLIPGIAVVGGGASLLVAAKKKRKAFNEAWGVPSARLKLTPTLNVGRSGGQAGLVLRF